jgi:hypothetical protein
VRQQLLLPVPEPLPIALDLGQRLVVEAHRGQKRRRAVEPIGPHLGRAEDVVEDSLRRCAGALFRIQSSSAVDRLAHLGIAGPLGCLGVGWAAHRGIGRTAGDHHAQPPVRRPLDHGRLGKQNDPLAVAGLDHACAKDALLPVAALHGHGRRCGRSMRRALSEE